VYRRVREIQLTVDALQKHIRQALLATNTREAVTHLGAVQQACATVLRQLENALHERGPDADSKDRDVHPGIIQAASRSMNLAVENCERVALGTNIDEMRDRLVDVKTQIDYVDAYLRISLGTEER
jgi:uncharacterized membrane protein YccC